MALTFPPSPNVGDTYLSYVWDGTKWGVQAGVGGVAGVSSFNTRVGAVVLALGDVTSATGSGSTAQASLGLATVAASGAYADLSGAPSLASYAPLAAPVFTGDARAVTPAVGDNDTSIATTAFVAAAVQPVANNVGRNVLHNSLFNIQQRGAGAFITGNAFTADRWQMLLNNDTFSVSIAATPSGGYAGDEAQKFYLSCNVTGSATAGSYSVIRQAIEGVARTAGKAVTLSFYCGIGAGTANVGVDLVQAFGTGGAPSTAVPVTQQVVAVSTAWARYSVTFNLPSIAGKTLGTNSNDYLEARLWLSSTGSSVGRQTATFGLWGVQLEIGSVATPLEKLDPQQDLAKCQRFYQLVTAHALTTAAGAGAFVGTGAKLSPSMRASPTLTAAGDVIPPVNTAAINTDNITTESFRVWAASNGAGQMNFDRIYAASADL